MKNYKLYHGDAFEIIKSLQQENIIVDHIITDPPWNISVKNGDHFETMGRSGLDFGNWDYEFDLTGWIEPYTKILNKNGTIIIFCAIQDIGKIATELERLGFEMKNEIRWVKNNPMPRNRDRRFIRDAEYAVYAVRKNSKWVFNRAADTPYCRPEFRHSIVMGKERMHTTQKPIKLMEDIIKITTNENDIVLDPFMGVASTGVAAFNLKRKFIGIEKDERYFGIAKNRMEFLYGKD